jgi:hypothetical protein
MPSPDSAKDFRLETANVCFLSDANLAAGVDTEDVGSDKHNRSCAEVFFRFWLYRGNCPESISKTVAALKSQHPELHDFVLKLRAVRDEQIANDLVDEESLFERRSKEKAETACSPAALAVEAALKQRVTSFRKAHGIIPLVLVENGNAIPVPFQMTQRRGDDASCVDVEGKAVGAWSEILTPVLKTLDTSEGVKILCELPDGIGAMDFADDGMALPVALGSYSLDHYAEINPFDVLATGAILDGGVAAATAVEAKVELARKMGVHVWVQPSPCDKDANAPHHVLSLASDQPLKRALDAIRRSLAEIGVAKATVRHAREIIARYFHLPPSTAVSIQEAIATIKKNIQALVDEDNEFLRPSITDGRILLASLHNHAGDAKSSVEVLDGIEALWAIDKARLCKIYARKVVAFTDLGNLKEAENLGRKARAIAFKLDIPVPEQAEVLVETTGSLGGEALLHKALRTGKEADSVEAYELLNITLDTTEELARAGHQTPHVDADLWYAKSAVRYVLWHAYFRPTKITDLIKEYQSVVEAPRLAGKHDISEEYLKRTHFLGGYRALLAGKAPAQNEFTGWPMPSLQAGAPEWVVATALKYRGALKAHNGDVSAQADFEEAVKLLRGNPHATLRVILWSIAAEARLSGIASPILQRVLAEGIYDVVDYLSWDASMAGFTDKLLSGNYGDADLAEFRRKFAY